MQKNEELLPTKAILKTKELIEKYNCVVSIFLFFTATSEY